MLALTRLRVLAALARHGSVTATAEALHYAQASVSHHLSRLEAETGAVLVQRVGRGVRLTEAGLLLAARAEEILGRVAAAEAELAALTGLRAGRVRLAAFPSALGTFVPTALAALGADHPGLRVSLVEAEPPDALALLRAGEVDLAVTFRHDDEPVPADLRAVDLVTEPLYLVTADPIASVPADPARVAPAATDRPPSAPAGADLAAYAGAAWIAGCERCRAHLLRRCAAAGFVPDIAFTTDDYVAVQSLVAAGAGVATLPGLALVASRHPAVHVHPLPDDGRHVSVATYGDAPDPPATTALLAVLRTATTAAFAWPH